MTTVVASKFHGEMAADRLIIHGELSFEHRKIFQIDKFLVGFCGNPHNGIAFTEWFRDNVVNKNKADKPTMDDDFESIVLCPGHIYVYDSSLVRLEVRRKWYAIGSGDQGACVALDLGLDPKDAILAASRWDRNTGRKIDVFSLT